MDAASSSSSGSVEWWEALCSSMNTDPARCTQVITAFKESPQAFDLSLRYIMDTRLSPPAKFQALQVFQFCLLVKKWGMMSAQEKMDGTQSVWRLLKDDIALNVQNVSPNYLTVKFMQTFAALCKRMWNDGVDNAYKIAVLTEMSGLFQNSSTLYNGAKLFNTMIGEFSFRGSVEQGLPLEFHRLARTSYEATGLQQTLEIAFHSTTSLLSTIVHHYRTTTTSTVADGFDPTLRGAIVGLNECCKLYTEVLSWSGQNSDIMDLSSSHRNISSIKIPESWNPFVRNEQFINNLVEVYNMIRNSVVGTALKCREEVIDLLSSIRSVLSIFVKSASFEEHSAFLNFLAQKCSAMMTAGIADIPEQFHNQVDSVEFRNQECDGVSSIVNQLLKSLSYDQLIKLPEFQSSFLALSNCVVELSKELDLMSLYYMSQAKDDSVTAKAILKSSKKMYCSIKYEDDDLLANWRHNILNNCLDLLTHFTDTIEREAIEHGKRVCDEVTLNSALRAVCPQLFTKLYETYTKLIVSDSMVHHGEEEVDEQEEISERNIIDTVSQVIKK